MSAAGETGEEELTSNGIMERKEAAEYLGISMRTLDRVVSKGRLTKGRALKKTRPVVVFEESEVRELKAELDARQGQRTGTGSTIAEPADTVAFRLDPAYFSRLETEGSNHGLSSGQYARRLVIQSLEDTRLEQIRTEIKELREGLTEMFYLVLVHKMGASESEADEIVSTLGRRG